MTPSAEHRGRPPGELGPRLLFARLTETLNQFVEEYRLHHPNDKVSEEWSVKDVLCHITYWHQYYAENLATEAKGIAFVFRNIRGSQINQTGVESLRSYSDEQIVGRLTAGHKMLKRSVYSGKVTQMTYRKGAKPYSLSEFLDIIDRHIQRHTAAMKKAKKARSADE